MIKSEILNGSSISQELILLDKIMKMPNAFVGWVNEYNSADNTLSVLPALQGEVNSLESTQTTYYNKNLLVNVWCVGNFLRRPPQKGDKVVCFVLDQKSNSFFKSVYNSQLPLSQQTYKPINKKYKSKNDLVAFVIGNNVEVISANEQPIGVWLDGKTIYRKTYVIDISEQTTTWSLFFSINDINFDKIWTNLTYTFIDGGSQYSLNSYNSSGVDVDFFNTYIDVPSKRVYARGKMAGTFSNLYVTIEYTKN